MATAKAFMHSIEELLKQPDFIRSERLSAAILNSMGNDCQADREKLDQLVKALQFIAATASPTTAPFLKLAFDQIERLSKQSVSADPRPPKRHKKPQYRTASLQKSRVVRSGARIAG
jgi:hypothetical protein